MPMFPHGRPTELLVQLNCQPSLQPSTATDDFSDCPSDSDSSTASGATASEEPKRDPRYDVPWVEYDIVRGWQSVHAAFHTFARQCDCWPLTCRSGHVSQAGITYRMECGYSNRIGCPWQCRVFIAFDQGHALTQYQRKYSIAKAPGGSTEAADTRCYDRQTMFVVPHDLRMFTHANHVCVISTAHVHANHNGFCKHGPHCMWEAYCALTPYALHFRSSEIQKWLTDRKIDCMHVDPITGVRTNQVSVMVKKCKRYCERLNRGDNLGDDVRSNYEGKLLSVCQKYDLKETSMRLGHAAFTAHTPYIVPGWSANKDEDRPAGGYCILVSTFDLALNHARAQHWFDGDVTLAIDHTFKVKPHCLCHAHCAFVLL